MRGHDGTATGDIVVARWNARFAWARLAWNPAQQAASFLLAAAAAVAPLPTLRAVADVVGAPGERRGADGAAAAMRAVVLAGTVAELVMWLGHLWLPRPHRRLPLWSLRLPGLSRVVADAPGGPIGRRPALNAALTVALLVALLWALAAPAVAPSAAGGASAALRVAVALFAVAVTVDGWRLLYSHYWLVGLAALAASPRPLGAIAVVFGSLYLWAGFFKLTSRLYYESTAALVFGFAVDAVRRAAARLVGPRLADRVVPSTAVVAGAGVLLETLLGAGVLALAPLLHAPAPAAAASGTYAAVMACALPPWAEGVARLVAAGALAMHGYICLGIGLRHRVWTFVSWNAMCAAVVAVLCAAAVAGSDADAEWGAAAAAATHVCGLRDFWFLSDSSGGGAVDAEGAVEDWVAWWRRWAVFLGAAAAMNVPPLLSLLAPHTRAGSWGRALVGGGRRYAYPTLCHQWFVPDAAGRQTVIFAAHAHSRVALRDNGWDVVCFRDDTFPKFVAAFGGSPLRLAEALHVRPAAAIERVAAAEAAGDVATAAALVKEATMCVDGEWVDRVFRYGPTDPCNENFGAGPPGFWATVGREVLRCPAVRLTEHPRTWLAAAADDVDVFPYDAGPADRR